MMHVDGVSNGNFKGSYLRGGDSTIYCAGMKHDYVLVSDLFSAEGELRAWAMIGAPMGLLDLPFSLAGDTLLLPCDVYLNVRYEHGL